jgi:phosphomannomutase
MSDNILILFDVDGTLTEPRCLIKPNMIEMILCLRDQSNLDIGIVGGSDYNKQVEQLGPSILEMFDYVFSENGLVAYHYNELINKTSIIDHYGNSNMQFIINTILGYLATVEIPVKRGTFIELRDGMLNVSPIGRSCNLEERIAFYEYDKVHKVREKMIEYLKTKLYKLNLTFSIGGQISFDIFPRGWDKTYCLQFVKHKYSKIYFFGDKTYEGGNDYEIYNSKLTVGYSVTSPDDTINHLKELFNL